MLGFMQDGFQRYLSRHRPARAGQGCGRKIPGAAAGLQRDRARGIFRISLADLFSHVRG